MQRRILLLLATSGLILSGLPFPSTAGQRVFYTPGLAEAAMADNKVVILHFWTNWCSTCVTQNRVLSRLRAANPAYDTRITFITVNWDKYANSDLSRNLNIRHRSTIVALKGKNELSRIVAGTAHKEIEALLDLTLTAAID
jgi:thioredoxin 1